MPHLYKLSAEMYISMKRNLKMLMNNIFHSVANKTCAQLCICMHVSKTKDMYSEEICL
jgi:hypothetical protein